MNEKALPLLDPQQGIVLCAGIDSLYFDLLRRFPQDQTIHALRASLHAGCAQDAFLHAHTLKGLSAQLALPALHEAASSLCGLLRAPDDHAMQAANAQLPALLALCDQTIFAIDALLDAKT